jgi:hypothetical protein
MVIDIGRYYMEIEIWKKIGLSWLSLKSWVKIWLFFLNFVFITVIVFWNRSEFLWILTAYVASGPLLLFIAYHQRGLTRLLGIAHIIPWVPLLVLIGVSLYQFMPVWRSDPYYFFYLLMLLDVLIICLSFDVYDVYRWYKGERYIMGSKEAYTHGASDIRF